MGVAGSGKTTIGSLVSKQTGSYFVEGDNFHSKKNIKKMSSGIPLNDSDRMGWLKSIKDETRPNTSSDERFVVSKTKSKLECSSIST